ncbi:hypothetical protein ST47_g3308 [Ascochyta rabiei]|uniref:Uncharacterized protein n=1 Tax=Didymella rabiei TaxID=5454 RepID=A0A163HY19_DIDRA|nr:hypothetical protein ST47_g3308 [Ascochyta rabiei]
MDHSYESIVSASDFIPMVVTPNLSPQLNETICGCRCGCGCGCAGHGNGDVCDRVSDGESETAVESSNSDDGQGFSPGPEAHDNPPNGYVNDQSYRSLLSPRALSHRMIVWLMDGAESLDHSELLTGWEHITARPLLHDGCEHVPETLGNEPCSAGPRSNEPSVHRSIQRMSPGPGIGGWSIPDSTSVGSVQLVHYFHVRPLRLSAEYEHARGKAVAHLVTPDECSFQDNVRE